MRLNEGNLVQLGHGACQRRIWTAETDLTSAIAENIASDKDLTKSLLQACGVARPVLVASNDPSAYGLTLQRKRGLPARPCPWPARRPCPLSKLNPTFILTRIS